MLVLTRKRNESVIIGDDIEVTICGMEFGQVRVGFSAPKDVRIDRKEKRLREDSKKTGGYHATV